jgi:hypothetical protein
MNHWFGFILSLFFLPLCAIESFELLIEPHWLNLDPHAKHELQFGGKWILASTITFKKNSRQQVSLNRLDFHWQGKPLSTLIGSLYKKTHDHEFLPLEENLIGDGIWKSSAQTLIFNFNKSLNLNVVNTFYLVLTVPENQEKTITHGSFIIEHKTLPDPIKLVLKNEPHILKFTPDTLATCADL